MILQPGTQFLPSPSTERKKLTAYLDIFSESVAEKLALVNVDQGNTGLLQLARVLRTRNHDGPKIQNLPLWAVFCRSRTVPECEGWAEGHPVAGMNNIVPALRDTFIMVVRDTCDGPWECPNIDDILSSNSHGYVWARKRCLVWAKKCDRSPLSCMTPILCLSLHSLLLTYSLFAVEKDVEWGNSGGSSWWKVSSSCGMLGWS